MISTPNDFVKQTLMSYYTAMRRLMKKRENRATLPAGHALPAISLTSDNGMWFKPEDYNGRKQILFVFFDSRDPVRAAGTLSPIQEQLGSLQRFGVQVFDVSHHPPAVLRSLSAS